MNDEEHEGGEDEMTEPKADQEINGESSEIEMLGLNEDKKNLKLTRKGSIMSPLKGNRGDESSDENDAEAFNREEKHSLKLKTSSSKINGQAPLLKRKSSVHNNQNEKTRLRSGTQFSQ